LALIGTTLKATGLIRQAVSQPLEKGKFEPVPVICMVGDEQADAHRRDFTDGLGESAPF